MTKFLILAALIAGTGVAQAGDSTWIVCKGVATVDGSKIHAVVSVLEHRSSDSGFRDLDVTMLRGANIARGEVRGKKVGDVVGKAVAAELAADNKKVAWKGTITVANDFKTVALTGTFDEAFGLDPKPTFAKYAAKLTCETFDDLAIGH